jgi:quinate/shikimate dehydrogenase (NAD+)
MSTPSPKTDHTLALVGHGISRSLTPAMQQREGAEVGLDVDYRIIDAAGGGFGAEDIADLLVWAQRFGFDGFNITHPFKQVVMPLLDEISDDAVDLGAVNTVVFRDGRACGHNTDWSGWGRAFRRQLPAAVTDRVVLIGAGGAGAAVGYALLDQGAEHVTVVDVDLAKAEECVLRLAKRYGADRVGAAADPAAALADAQGLVNATPIGMVGHPGLPIDSALVRADIWVSDVVYRPLETELISLARGRGCPVVPGGGMAVFQAVGAFELFTGRAADPERMLRHFEELTR